MPPEREKDDFNTFKNSPAKIRMYNCGAQWILRPKFIQWESFIRDSQSPSIRYNPLRIVSVLLMAFNVEPGCRPLISQAPKLQQTIPHIAPRQIIILRKIAITRVVGLILMSIITLIGTRIFIKIKQVLLLGIH